MLKLNLSIVLIEILLSFYLRWNFSPFYQLFGFYQGDIWYFYTYFADQIKNLYFYPFDYPVGYLLIHKLTFWVTVNIFKQSYEFFLLSNALIIIPTLLLLVLLIYKIAEILKIKQSLLFPFLVFSPSLIIYSNINYDIFPSTLVILATFLAFKKKFNSSFFCLALGSTIKLYPIFLLPIFLMMMLNQKVKLTNIIQSIFIFVITSILINLPFMLYNFTFWLHPYLHQLINMERDDPTTLSYFLFNLTHFGSLQEFFIFLLLSIAYLISWMFLKKSLLYGKNFLLLLLFCSFSLVLGNHVYTPQYLLWFLPFVALTQIPNIYLWWPLDLINAATRLFYFKLKTDYVILFNLTHQLTIIYFVIFYSFLLYRITKILKS